MDRYDKLKRLKNEITRLFHERIDESKAYDLLQANPDFGSFVRRADIHSLYGHLKEKDELTAEDEDQIKAWEDEEKQMMAKLECIEEYHQDSTKYWLYDEVTDKSRRVIDVWQSRYLVINENSNQKGVHSFKVLDMFQNVSKLFTIQKIQSFYRMHILVFPFILLHESFGGIDYFRLLRFSIESDSLHQVQSFVYEGNYFIFVDQFNSSKFILGGQQGEMHNCKLLNRQIQIGDRFDIEWHPWYIFTSYFNNQLYSLKFERVNNITKILTYNLELRKSESFVLSSFPEHFRFVEFEERQLSYCGWINDHFFTPVRCNLTAEYGIAFTEPMTCKWTLIEFVTKIPIKFVKFVDGQDLMIYAEEGKWNKKPCKLEIYKISMHKPDSLRNKAWITLVKKFKKDDKIKDPYAEARKFLPLNSEIHEFIFFQD